MFRFKDSMTVNQRAIGNRAPPIGKQKDVDAIGDDIEAVAAAAADQTGKQTLRPAMDMDRMPNRALLLALLCRCPCRVVDNPELGSLHRHPVRFVSCN